MRIRTRRVCIRYLWFTGSIHANQPGPVPFQASKALSLGAVMQNPTSGSTAKSQGSGEQKAVSLCPPEAITKQKQREGFEKFCDSDGGTVR